MRMILIGLAVVLLVTGLFLFRPAFLATLDFKIYDALTAQIPAGPSSDKIAIVAVDEPSLAQLGRWPWPRDLLSSIVERIFDQGAAVVVLDMMLPEPDRKLSQSAQVLPPQGIANDDIFMAAIAGKPTVLGYSMTFDDKPSGQSPCILSQLPLIVIGTNRTDDRTFFRAKGTVCNVPDISGIAAGSGFLNAAPDQDGKLRRIPLVIEYQGKHYPSLALAALNVYRPAGKLQITAGMAGASGLSLDQRRIPLEDRSCIRLHFRGPKRSFPHISAVDVLSGNASAKQRRDKIVIVGLTASGLQSSVITPVDSVFPGVEVQATAIENLLQGDVFRRPNEALLAELLLALLAGIVSTLLLVLVRSLWGTWGTIAIAICVWISCAWILSLTKVLLSPLPALTVLLCNYSVLTLINYWQEKRRADETEQELVSVEKHSQEVLSESERRYQQLVENINDAITINDLSGRLVFANRRFRELFGLNEKDIRETVLENYVAPEWHSQVRDHYDRQVQGEALPESIEFEGLCTDGARIWIEALITEFRENGKIVGTQSALRDTTERKRIEEQYLQAQKMESVGRLAGGIAHDFNNLLTIINGYSDLLLAQIKPENLLRGPVEEIQKAGASAAELTRKLLTLSRKQISQPKPIDINHLIADSKKLWSRITGEDVEIVIHLGRLSGHVMIDPGQMNQVLMNLVVNARDAMPNGGKLTIETRDVEVVKSNLNRAPEIKCGSYIYIGVTDTGSGMSEDIQRHIFEPFYTTKEQGKGTGLGLSTVYSIIHDCGGQIRVRSEEGQGTTFHMYLPRQSKTSLKAMEVEALVTTTGGSETVLLVEDQEAVRQLAKVILENLGYSVLQASDGQEAISMAGEYQGEIHLLLTDVILPKMNGRQIAEHLKTVRPGIKVLFVSGYSDDIISQHGVLDENVAYLAKPFHHNTLAVKVREVLSGGANSLKTR